MELKDLKESIENGNVTLPIVFIAEHDNFIVWQYIHEISKLKNKEIKMVDEIEDSMFTVNNSISVFLADRFDDVPPNNYIVIAKNGSGVKVPKVEAWMLDEMAAGMCPGIKNNEIPKFYKNPYRVYSELEKLSMFPVGAQDELYTFMLNDGSYGDGNMKTAPELANAIATFDDESVKNILLNRDNCDLTDMYFIVSLRNIFEKLLKVRTLKFPTAMQVGCSSPQQLNFFKVIANKYQAKNLLDIFMFICDLDYRIRGEGSLENIDIVKYATTEIMLKRR